MRQPLDYPEMNMWDLIEELPPWGRVILGCVAAVVMSGTAFLVGYLMAVLGA